MDISSMTVTPTPNTTAQAEVSVAVQRQVMDQQRAMAQQMVQSIEKSGQALPDHLGRNINVTA